MYTAPTSLARLEDSTFTALMYTAPTSLARSLTSVTLTPLGPAHLTPTPTPPSLPPSIQLYTNFSWTCTCLMNEERTARQVTAVTVTGTTGNRRNRRGHHR
eukprot:337038-Chlamydomonas_euryale.AAC.9